MKSAKRMPRLIVATMVAMICCVLLQEVKAQSCSKNMLQIDAHGSYVAVPDVPALRLTKGFTIECWAKLNSPSKSALLQKGNSAISYYGVFLDTGSRTYGRVHTKTNVSLYSPAIDTLTAWHHYAFVFAPKDSFYYYVDGNEVASAKTFDSVLDFSTDSLRIGANGAGISVIGDVDEVRMWDRPRSVASIRSNLYHTLTGNESGLILYYPFDDQTNSIRIHDFSNHGNDGFIRGGNGDIVPSSSPIQTAAPGFRLSAKDLTVDLGERRCTPYFDTIIYLRNLGTNPLLVNSIGFYRGVAFSVTSDLPFYLPADTTHYLGLRIHFAAPTGGVFNDTLYISDTSSDCAGVLKIGLSATYDSVGLVSTPDTLRFGSLLQCDAPIRRTATIRNTSTTDSITVTGSSVPSGFTLLTPVPFTLQKGESKSILVQMDQGTRGPVTLVLGLQLDKCSRTALVGLQGARQLAQLSLPQQVDFPSVNATITGVSLDTVVILRNTGDVATTFNYITTTPDTLLQLQEPRQQFLQPNDTIQLRVGFHTTLCGKQTGYLKVQARACSYDVAVPVTVNVNSPATVKASSVDVGATCSFKDTIITVFNPNPDSVRLESLSFSQDAVFFTPFGYFPRTIAAHATDTIPVRFNPGTNGDYHVTGLLTSTPCGLASLDLRGSMGIIGLVASPSVADFGHGCQTAPQAESVSVTNSSTRTITIADTTFSGSRDYTVEAITLPFSLNPGESKNLTIHHNPRLGSFDNLRFSLIAAEGCRAIDIVAKGSREIAAGKWSAPRLEFDTVCPGNSEELSVDVLNVGIDSFDVVSASLTSGSGVFAVTSASTGVGKSSSGSVRIRFTPSAATEYIDTLRLQIDQCGTTLSLPLHGSGGSSPAIITGVAAHDFGQVLVGDSAEYCITLTNPSCSAIQITDSLLGISSHYHLSTATTELLPYSLDRGHPLNLCVVYVPNSYGTDSQVINLQAGNTTYGSIELTGVGLAADLVFNPHVVDFGYVLHGQSKVLPIGIRNRGNFGALTNHSIVGSNDYTISGLGTLGAGDTATIYVTFLPKPTTAFATADLVVSWNDAKDTIHLQGQGTEKGLLLSSIAVPFGDVHVHYDSIRELDITALLDLPIVDSITYSGQAVYKFSVDKPLPYHIAGETDTLRAFITYHPDEETIDGGTLYIYNTSSSGSTVISVPVTGRGVEAHPWLNATRVDFGPVLMGDAVTLQPVQIANKGMYPLYITNVVADTPFTVGPNLPNAPLAPGQIRKFDITFGPGRARHYVDTLRFVTSSPDALPAVVLEGTGVHSVPAKIGYVIGSVAAKSGDVVDIPISMFGDNLDHLDLDSITLDLAFDPTMVAFREVRTGDIAKNPRMYHLSDSVVRVSAQAPTGATGTLMWLQAEALLGSHPVTHIRDTSADPVRAISPLATDGTFTVTDCGGSLHGVQFTGNYQVSAVVPNPVGNAALLKYRLGLAGAVQIELYNSVGQRISVLDLGEQQEGPHSASLDLSRVPNGRYVYRFRSLEYASEGSIVVIH